MNRATKFTAAAWGIILGISGLSHGFFEALQGSTPTEGLFINAIGETHRMWEHGAEPAITIIPNFLITGLAAMLVGLAIIIWSARFLDRRHGATVFLLLVVLLVLVGGGIAQVVLFPVVWAVATRIHKPLTWWRRVLPENARGLLARLWPWVLGASAALLLLTLAVATFGYFPGVNDDEQILNIMAVSLVGGFGLYFVAALSGFAYDIRRQGA
ncbi:MAG: hypothetical protein HXY41_00490 [Chloroflexi bacterium]|nr:hypothetical protein [Chloroflexota bacterium]